MCDLPNGGLMVRAKRLMCAAHGSFDRRQRLRRTPRRRRRSGRLTIGPYAMTDLRAKIGAEAIGLILSAHFTGNGLRIKVVQTVAASGRPIKGAGEATDPM